MFTTRTELQGFAYDGKAFVVSLGLPLPESVPRVRRVFFPAVTPAAVEAVRGMAPERLRGGVELCIAPETYAGAPELCDAVQRHLAWAYCKYVVFPGHSMTIPDPLKVRSEPEALLPHREVSKSRNLPLHLASPLCDVLGELELRPPVLILLPGPSLQSVLPWLYTLKQRCCIVCVSRTVRPCLDAGVAPDFVVNLDTDLRMAGMLDVGRDLPDTWLVSLSLANIREVSARYRGVFFMESFDLRMLRNRYRLRESWLSCSISALGLAEALRAPEVFIAGGDHSWRGSRDAATPYHGLDATQGGGQAEGLDGPPLVSSGHGLGSGRVPYDCFAVRDRQGRKAWTYFHYLAIAHELDMTARELTGTAWHLVGDEGILSRDAFRSADLEQLKARPLLDRRRLQRELDQVQSHVPEVELDALHEELRARRQVVRSQAAYLDFLLCNGETDKARAHPVCEAVAKGMAAHKLPQAVDSIPELTLRLCRAWQGALDENLALLGYLRELRPLGSAPVLCTLEEFKRQYVESYRDAVPAMLTPLAVLPADLINWQLRQGHTSTRFFDFMHLFTELSRFAMAFVTRNALREHALLTQLLDPARVMVLEDVPRALLRAPL